MPIAEAKVTAPPPRRNKPSTPSRSSVTADDIQQQRVESIAGIAQMLSGIASAFGQWADAGTIEMHGGSLAREVAELGAKYESVGKRIDNLSQVTPFFGIATVTFAMTIQFATNHKWISKEAGVSMGATPPEVLEGEMRLTATRRAYEMQQAQLLREKMMMEELAEREAALQAEMADSQ